MPTLRVYAQHVYSMCHCTYDLNLVINIFDITWLLDVCFCFCTGSYYGLLRIVLPCKHILIAKTNSQRLTQWIIQAHNRTTSTKRLANPCPLQICMHRSRGLTSMLQRRHWVPVPAALWQKRSHSANSYAINSCTHTPKYQNWRRHTKLALCAKAYLRRRLEGFSFTNLAHIWGNNFSVGTANPGRLISDSKTWWKSPPRQRTCRYLESTAWSHISELSWDWRTTCTV